MKRTLTILFCLLLGAAAHADDRSAQLLSKLSSALRGMGCYRVEFEVVSDDLRTAGHYVVEGDGYYLRIGDAEVYCDGRTRWEVDPGKREVVIDTVDGGSRNLLDNPTRGFDFLNETFAHAVVGEENGTAVVRLASADASAPVGTITLTLDAGSGIPHAVAYDFDGEQVVIVISRVAAEPNPPAPFSAAKYPDFETIDFR